MFHNIQFSPIQVLYPFFFKSKEKFCESGQIKHISKNEVINIKKINSFGIILEGIFELAQKLSGENIYLSSGTFFGDVPFTDSRYIGSIKAVVNSRIILFNPDEIYRVLLSSYKGLRGYIRNLKRNGFEVINYGRDFLRTGSKVITVFSNNHKSGNSIITSLLATFLSESGKTIILDASYGNPSSGILSTGKGSIFNIFEKEFKLMKNRIEI